MCEQEQDTDVNSMWEDIKSAFNSTSDELLGTRKPTQSKPWISEEVLDLCKERSKLKLEKLADPSKRPKCNYLNREAQRNKERMQGVARTNGLRTNAQM